MSNLRESACLVDIVVSMGFSKYKRDREETNRVNAVNKTKNNVARVNKTVFTKEDLKGLYTIERDIRDYKDTYTSPWERGSFDLLAAKHIMNFQSKMGEFRQKLKSEASKFADRLDEIKEHAKDELGDLYKDEDYPTREHIVDSTGLKVLIIPLPDTDDIRLMSGISEADKSKLVEDVTRDVTERNFKAVKSSWNKLFEKIEKLVIALEGKRFSFSHIENIEGLLDALDVLNVTNDPDLALMGEEIRSKLTIHDQDDLKNKETKAYVASEARDIMSKMSSFMA